MQVVVSIREELEQLRNAELTPGQMAIYETVVRKNPGVSFIDSGWTALLGELTKDVVRTLSGESTCGQHLRQFVIEATMNRTEENMGDQYDEFFSEHLDSIHGDFTAQLRGTVSKRSLWKVAVRGDVIVLSKVGEGLLIEELMLDLNFDYQRFVNHIYTAH